jgi:Flp pilus assembly protein TadG
MRRLVRADRGSATLELVVWGPVLLLILGAVLVGGRLALAHQSVEAAAAEAARAATAAPDVATARVAALDAASTSLSSAGLACDTPSVQVDTSQWGLPAGVPGRATATVACTVPLGDLAVPGFPGTRLVTASASSALDTFRARS